jgi:hypothetical protein
VQGQTALVAQGQDSLVRILAARKIPEGVRFAAANRPPILMNGAR